LKEKSKKKELKGMVLKGKKRERERGVKEGLVSLQFFFQKFMVKR
jgi:hypothetical protein